MRQEQTRALAQGRLQDTPFAHMLLHMEQHGLSGVLELVDSRGGLTQVEVIEGYPTMAIFAQRPSSLYTGLVALCAVADGEYHYYDEALRGAEGFLLRGRVDPLSLVATASRQQLRMDVVQRILQRYQGDCLRLQPGKPLHRLQLTAEEQSVLDLLRAAPCTIAELVRLSSWTAERTRALVYTLLVTRMLAPYTIQREETQFSQVRPRVGTSQVLARWPVALTQAQSALAEGSPQRALLLLADPGAGSPEARARFLGLQAHALLARLEQLMGNRRRAVPPPPRVADALAEAVAKAPRDAHTLFAQGLSSQLAGDDGAALRCFRHAVLADPELAAAAERVQALSQAIAR